MGLLALVLLGVACATVGGPRGWMPPTTFDRSLLLSLEAGELAAVDPQEWRVQWRFPGDDDIRPQAFYGAPAVGQELVYVGGYDGTVYALERGSGQLRWRYKTGGPIIGGLALDPVSRLLLVPSDDGRLYGLDAQEGTLRPGWPFRAGKGIWSRPVIVGDTVYVGSLDGQVYALDIATGQERWHLDLGAGVASDLALADGLLLVGLTDRRLYAVDARAGSLAWKTPFRADNWFWAQPLPQGDVVYAPNLDGRIYALALADGSTRWVFPTPERPALEPVRARPLLAGGVLVVVDRGGNVYGLDPASGQPRWGPVALGDIVLADPLAMDGRVLVMTQKGQAFLVDPGTGRVERKDIRP